MSIRSFAVAVALLVFLAAPANAQQITQPTGSTLSGLVTAQYDSTADSTRVRTAVVPVRGALKMYAGYRFAGEEPSEPLSSVYLVFQEASTSPGWENPHGRSLELWLDDTAKIEVPRTDYLRHAKYERGLITMDVTEWVWATLPAETFARIAAAKKVEGRLGPRRFELGRQQLGTLRELAAHIPATQSATSAGAVEP